MHSWFSIFIVHVHILTGIDGLHKKKIEFIDMSSLYFEQEKEFRKIRKDMIFMSQLRASHDFFVFCLKYKDDMPIDSIFF